MQTHTYESNTFVWGPGCTTGLPSRLESEGVERGLLVCGEYVSANDALMNTVRDTLDDVLVHTYTGVMSDTPIETVEAGVEAKRDHDADAVISIGGGSASDTAKAIAVFDAEEGRSMRDMKTETTAAGETYIPEMPAAKDPVFAIATTLSAAEVSNAFGVTDPDVGEKGVLVDEKVRPVASYYDSELTATTPSSVIASTGMNALNHAVETLYSDPRGENPFYQSTSMRAIALLMDNLADAVADSSHTEVMQNVQIGAALSALGLVGGICINHGINHALCARHPVSHGDGNSILLPHGIKFNASTVPERIRRIAKAMNINIEGRNDDWVVQKVLGEVRSLQNAIDVPYRLRGMDIIHDDFDTMAEIAAKDSAMASNPRQVTSDDIRDILNAAW